MNLAAYVLTIHSPEPEPAQGSGPRLTDEDKRVLANLPAMLEASEEDLTDLLPEGYGVEITEAFHGLRIGDETWAGLVQQALDGWLKEPGISSEAAVAGTLLQELLTKEIG